MRWKLCKHPLSVKLHSFTLLYYYWVNCEYKYIQYVHGAVANIDTKRFCKELPEKNFFHLHIIGQFPLTSLQQALELVYFLMD